MRARYTPVDRRDVPFALQEVLEHAMMRDPAARLPTAAALGVALQQVQRSLGQSPTPFEAPTDEWTAMGGIDLDDSAARGPVRSAVPSLSPRRLRSELNSGAGRPEDGLVDDPRPLRKLFSRRAVGR
jgi:hypothetical protein